MDIGNTIRESAPSMRFGTVSEKDPATMRVRVTLPELDGLETDFLPVLTRKSQDDKDYWLPDEGEQVVVMLDAFGDYGVVIGSIFSDVDTVPVEDQDKRKVVFKDKADFEYDRQSSTLTIKGGIKHLVVECGVDINMEATTTITLKAPLITLDAPLVQATGLVRCQMIQVAGGSVPGVPSAPYPAMFTGGMQSIGDINTLGNMDTTGNIKATGDMAAMGNMAATGSVTATGNMTSSSNIFAAGNIVAGGQVIGSS